MSNIVKPVLRSHSIRRPKKIQDQLSLNAGQKYCRMLPLEHSAILSTFIKPPLVIKIIVLFFLGWLLKTGFTVYLGSLWKGQSLVFKDNEFYNCSLNIYWD